MKFSRWLALCSRPALLVTCAVLQTTCAGAFAQAPAAGEPGPKHPSEAFSQALDRLLNKQEYTPKQPEESRWLDGGERYTMLEAAAGKGTDLVSYETATGKRSVLISAKQLTPKGEKEPLSVEDYAWSADKTKLLIFTNAKKVWRANTRGDYWVLDRASSRLTQLGAGAPASSLMFAKFSPDARTVAYVRVNNLYVETLETGKARQLTSDGSADIINGTSDWVNEEELFIRDAFRWSPDSKSIAYWQFNQTGVGEYTLINDTATLYPETTHYKYPLVGTTNSAVRAGVVAVDGGPTTWFKLPGDPRSHYIPRMDWAGNSSEVAVEYMNRPQNAEQLFLADARTGELRPLFADKDAAYLDIVSTAEAMAHFTWLPDAAMTVDQAGSSAGAKAENSKPDLLWLSEKDGWRSAYRISRATGEARLLTKFAGDVIAPVGIDESEGLFYFTASPADPIRSYLYRARLDGTGTPERVTPASDTGTNNYDLAPGGKWAIHTFSNTSTPPRYELVKLPSHQVTRVLESNEALAKKLSTVPFVAKEFSQTAIGDGISLSTYMIKPPHFDPAKKYPVLVYIYGEPGVASVLDASGGIFTQLIAREGYLILCFDNEGTPQPRGRAWRKAGYGAIGVLSSQQQAEAIRAFAKEHPFVDTSRLAMWGWSGGGTNTLNMMFRYPGLYSTGIAVAPVPDQTRYDTIYQERYMGLPSENAKGYHDGSAINFASGLTGNLLIVHGSGDDNVHFQGTELLVNKLIEAGKVFDFMDYPNRTHGIYEGPGTSMHVLTLIVRYLEDHVPPGPLPQ